MTLREQLENPEIFQIHRLPAHSDHRIRAAEAGAAGTQCLDGVWQFAYSERLEDRPAGFEAEDYDLSDFGTIQVPGHMQLQGYGKPQYINTLFPWDGVELLRPPKTPEDFCPVGSYVRTFDLKRTPHSGEEVILSFQGVETAFSVWLNGVYVGYSEDSFTPSEFCVTDLVRKEGNKLAVEVYQRSSASWLEDQDFWRFAGIFRSVYIMTLPSQAVYDLSVTADYNYKKGVCDTGLPAADGKAAGEKKAKKPSVPVKAGVLRVQAKVMASRIPDPEKLLPVLSSPVGEEMTVDWIVGPVEEIEPLQISYGEPGCHIMKNDGAEDVEAKKREAEAKSAGGKKGRGREAVPTVPAERERKLWLLTWTAVVPEVEPWSAESPALYRLKLSLSRRETVEEQVGFRTFEMKDGIMCLNGKRIIFRGVNRHEFSYRTGRCVSDEDMRRDIELIRKNNMNAVRTCHYPDRSLWYRLCDEAGLYLIDETNLETHGTWQKLGQCEPSWNVPASLPEWKEAVLDRARSMYERDKNHPSVLIWSCGNESYAGDDIAAVSEYFHTVDPRRLVHYEGCFWNPEYRYISDMESRMYAKPAEIEAYLEGELAKKAEDPSYVMKPYISCEYMHAMGNSLGGMKLYTDLEDRYEGYQGGFIWDYMDQTLPLILPDGNEVQGVGGDFDDRPTDYGFCTNGIVYADRTASPKMPEVRQLYSPLRIDVSLKEVTVENRNLFTDTSGYRFTARSMVDGVMVEEKDLEISVAAGKSRTTRHGLKLPKGPGECVIEVAAYEGDTEIAFGQCVETRGTRETAGCLFAGTFGQIVGGDGHIGLIGPDLQIQFSMTEGGLSSFRYKGKELIDRIPRISFWRAMTDNDMGAGYPAKMGIWHAAGHFAAKDYSSFGIEPVEGGLKMHTAFLGGPGGAVRTEVNYTLYPDGRILVEADFPGIEGFPELPVFAMDFATKPEVDRVTFLGMGPEENYTDRAEGARLGRFSFTAVENLSRYLRPQECGNRTGVREFTVCDAEGVGLRFVAAGDPFEMSVLPHSVYELEEANRIFELPPVRHTWIRVASAQMGVGGDDSWGAPVHEEYLIDSAKPQHLAFWITAVG